MTEHLILFKHYGEISHTARTPVGVFEPGAVDLTATKTALVSSDFWAKVEVALYAVRKVDLPEFLDPAEWVADHIAWKYTWGIGVDAAWGEAHQRGLHKIRKAEGSAAAIAAVKLLKVKKFRSSFRASLRDQLEAWLAGDSDFASPFSPRQWSALVNDYDRTEAKRREAALYGQDRAAGEPVATETLTAA